MMMEGSGSVLLNKGYGYGRPKNLGSGTLEKRLRPRFGKTDIRASVSWQGTLPITLYHARVSYL
jgi:hypothetical protein